MIDHNIEITIVVKSNYINKEYIIQDTIHKLTVNPFIASYKIDGVDYKYNPEIKNDGDTYDIIHSKAMLLLKAVSEITEIPIYLIRSKSRKRELVRARNIFMVHTLSLNLFKNISDISTFVGLNRCSIYNAQRVINNDTEHNKYEKLLFDESLMRYKEMLQDWNDAHTDIDYEKEENEFD